MAMTFGLIINGAAYTLPSIDIASTRDGELNADALTCSSWKAFANPGKSPPEIRMTSGTVPPAIIVCNLVR
ncbi:hypothetical protein D3C76_1710830 [compost metagenome]